MRSTEARALLVAAVLASSVPLAAGAQYPPGPLSSAHAHLEGLTKCTECHVLRDRASPDRCLACHREIASRVAARRGPHGKLPPSERGCGACHAEHIGRDVALVDWGPKGRDGFDHDPTGWPLRDAHARAACAKCHRRDRVVDADVRRVLASHPQKETYLGAPAACAGCHSDRHRGQLSRACESCHGGRAWKPADRFSHAKTSYPLTGKHERVACAACHLRESPIVRQCLPPYACEPEEEPWTPGYEAAIRYRPVPHDACERCHANTHAVQFSEACAACHGTRSWLAIDEARFVARHAETRYPLKGAHVKAPCRSCHGPWGGDKPRFVELPYRACTDCHADAHVGQLPAREGRPPDCGQCHALEGFKPVKYEADDHARTAFPLAAAHRAVACARCHPNDPSLPSRFPAKTRAALARQGRPARVALVRIRLEGRPFERCDGCHKGPHGAQLAERIRREGCSGCHEPASFRKSRLDHAKTAFPLAGKHGEAACVACHPKEKSERGAVTRFTGVPKRCDGCHDDLHAGQLTRDPADPACERCHDPATASWKKTRFVHAPPFTDYALAWGHAKVKCERCHFAVAVGERRVVRYRPLPPDCERCHADEHRGTFTGYEP